jgi:hypothetical protein
MEAVLLRNQRLSIHDAIVQNFFVITRRTQLLLVEVDFGLQFGSFVSCVQPPAELVELPDGGELQGRLPVLLRD